MTSTPETAGRPAETDSQEARAAPPVVCTAAPWHHASRPATGWPALRRIIIRNGTDRRREERAMTATTATAAVITVGCLVAFAFLPLIAMAGIGWLVTSILVGALAAPYLVGWERQHQPAPGRRRVAYQPESLAAALIAVMVVNRLGAQEEGDGDGM